MVRRDFGACRAWGGGSWRQSLSSLHRAGERLSTKQAGEPRRGPAGSGHVCRGRLRQTRLRYDCRRHPRRRPRHRFALALGSWSLSQRSPRRRAGSGSGSCCGGRAGLYTISFPARTASTAHTTTVRTIPAQITAIATRPRSILLQSAALGAGRVGSRPHASSAASGTGLTLGPSWSLSNQPADRPPLVTLAVGVRLAG